MMLRRLACYAAVPALLCSVPAVPPGMRPPLSIAVRGDHFVNQDGGTVILHGVNTSGTEYACVSQDSIFDGRAQASAASIAAMRSWGFNAARVQLNESCWLGIQGVRRNVSGAAYRRAIENYVAALNHAGMYVILDLHFSSAGGRAKATGQRPMPDARYAPAFWASVARSFKGNPAVIFDLFNEPYPDNNTDSAAAWTCDLRGSAGGTCRGIGYRATGMQHLLDVVRGAGATNVVLAGGPQYAGDLDRWARYAPADPRRQLAASIHVYWRNRSHPDYSPCYRPACWQRVLAPLSARVPVVAGEFGEFDCGDTLYLPFLRFADQHGISYLAWAWFTGGCAAEPSLITSYQTGAPTPYGIGYRNHLRLLGAAVDDQLVAARARCWTRWLPVC